MLLLLWGTSNSETGDTRQPQGPPAKLPTEFSEGYLVEITRYTESRCVQVQIVTIGNQKTEGELITLINAGACDLYVVH